jgi:hypothetical protein
MSIGSAAGTRSTRSLWVLAGRAAVVSRGADAEWACVEACVEARGAVVSRSRDGTGAAGAIV